MGEELGAAGAHAGAMSTVAAYHVPVAGSRLTRTTIERRPVGPDDVLIDIVGTGICHSDIHQARDGWGGGIFPMVPGHEIAGRVLEAGSAVTGFAAGDRVGVGCIIDSCRTCEHCAQGQEQFCVNMVFTYNARDSDGRPTYGGYARRIVVDHRYVVRIPDALSLEAAAPLMCAGVTTYAPLRRYGAGPGRRVAVIGLGGLGHLAVKIAHALGADVSVLSRSPGKAADARELGADHFFATGDPAMFDRLHGAFDLMLCTVSDPIDLGAYLGLLRTGGTLVNVGAPEEPVSLNLFALIDGGRTLAGSFIGGLAETQETLDFCAAHGIGADVELVPADRIDDAYARVLRGDVRYRFVLDTSTI
jgi:uncharacterized zinc-type alcohol dehydrogenase-like protein